METLDQIKARLKAIESGAYEAGLRATFTRPLQEDDSMPTLSDEIKEFIVKSLACFDTPSQVAEHVKVTFGVEVSRQQVYVYDPENTQPPAQRWRDLHAATRQALLRETAGIGALHKAVRLRMLDRMAHRWERGDPRLARLCLEQVAKECGGFYENRRPVVLNLPLSQPAALQSPELQAALPPHGSAAMVTSIRPRQLPDLSAVPPAS